MKLTLALVIAGTLMVGTVPHAGAQWFPYESACSALPSIYACNYQVQYQYSYQPQYQYWSQPQYQQWYQPSSQYWYQPQPTTSVYDYTQSYTPLFSVPAERSQRTLSDCLRAYGRTAGWADQVWMNLC
jgi:hypothetical protein